MDQLAALLEHWGNSQPRRGVLSEQEAMNGTSQEYLFLHVSPPPQDIDPRIPELIEDKRKVEGSSLEKLKGSKAAFPYSTHKSQPPNFISPVSFFPRQQNWLQPYTSAPKHYSLPSEAKTSSSRCCSDTVRQFSSHSIWLITWLGIPENECIEQWFPII